MQLERGRALTMRPGVSWSGSQQLVRRGAGFSARQRTGRPWVPLLVLISLRVFVVCSSVLCGTHACALHAGGFWWPPRGTALGGLLAAAGKGVPSGSRGSVECMLPPRTVSCC